MRTGSRSTHIVLYVLVFLLIVLLILICAVVFLHGLSQEYRSSPFSVPDDQISRQPRPTFSECLRTIPDLLTQTIGTIRRSPMPHRQITQNDTQASRDASVPSSSLDEPSQSSHDVSREVPTPVPAILPPPQLSRKNFDRFSCYDQVNHFLCVDLSDGTCLFIFSSYPSTRSISVDELDRKVSFQNDADRREYERLCKGLVFRYVPVLDAD